MHHKVLVLLAYLIAAGWKCRWSS